MREKEAPFRIYSEKDNPFGPPPDNRYSVDSEGRPILLARDTRMWASEEYLRWLLELQGVEAVEQED